MKKILCFLLCLICISSTFISCSKPPELSEIAPRLEELIEASYGVNKIIFGEGLPTYERVYDPIENLQYYEDTAAEKRYYYYTIEDAELGTVLAYRTRSYGDDFKYLLVTDALPEGKESVYFDEASGLYYVSIDYTEKEYDFYYNDSIPEGYDVVRLDAEYLTTDQIKAYAETVYSADYLESIYETLFDGVMISGDESGLLIARYTEFTDDYGTAWLLKSNKYEPLVSETRIFDLSTAEIQRGSNGEYVRIEMETYLESEPDVRLEVTVSMILQDGVWYLDSGTY